MKIGIYGVGFVGNAILTYFTNRGDEVYGYDRYKPVPDQDLALVFAADILYLCLPTEFVPFEGYQMSAMDDTLALLAEINFSGQILIKSTVEPDYCRTRSGKWPTLSIIHNPEFLTARTAVLDFAHQRHIILGCDGRPEMVQGWYAALFPEAVISHASYEEVALMKLACNTFYAIKVQYFTELYLLCEKLKMDYAKVVQLMLGNKWINPMHTVIPGPDGQISYGGACLPKDSKALETFMRAYSVPCEVITATINEQGLMREAEGKTELHKGQETRDVGN